MPVKEKSTKTIKYLYQKLGDKHPIIAVGGIHSAEDAMEKLNAGASLVQLYTGFIYEGPQLITDINNKILKLQKIKSSLKESILSKRTSPRTGLLQRILMILLRLV